MNYLFTILFVFILVSCHKTTYQGTSLSNSEKSELHLRQSEQANEAQALIEANREHKKKTEKRTEKYNKKNQKYLKELNKSPLQKRKEDSKQDQHRSPL